MYGSLAVGSSEGIVSWCPVRAPYRGTTMLRCKGRYWDMGFGSKQLSSINPLIASTYGGGRSEPLRWRRCTAALMPVRAGVIGPPTLSKVPYRAADAR